MRGSAADDDRRCAFVLWRDGEGAGGGGCARSCHGRSRGAERQDGAVSRGANCQVVGTWWGAADGLKH
jgi:hypothetical protein